MKKILAQHDFLRSSVTTITEIKNECQYYDCCNNKYSQRYRFHITRPRTYVRCLLFLSLSLSICLSVNKQKTPEAASAAATVPVFSYFSVKIDRILGAHVA